MNVVRVHHYFFLTRELYHFMEVEELLWKNSTNALALEGLPGQTKE